VLRPGTASQAESSPASARVCERETVTVIGTPSQAEPSQPKTDECEADRAQAAQFNDDCESDSGSQGLICQDLV
jgi:hypothetical protein